MRFIEIKDGFSIAIDKIETIEAIDDLTSRVHTSSSSYVANFPYLILLQILEREIEEQKGLNLSEETTKNMDAYFKQAGVFAG